MSKPRASLVVWKRVRCAILIACVTGLGGCVGPGLEPPGKSAASPGPMASNEPRGGADTTAAAAAPDNGGIPGTDTPVVTPMTAPPLAAAAGASAAAPVSPPAAPAPSLGSNTPSAAGAAGAAGTPTAGSSGMTGTEDAGVDDAGVRR
jgi:hypothetical protein